MRFIADFPIRCDTVADLVDGTADPATRTDSARLLRTLTHNLAGLAGIIGFHRVGTLAADLESLTGELENGAADLRVAHGVVDSMRAAFTDELAGLAPVALDCFRAAHHGDVLVVEDDDDQRTIIMNQLSAAGYRTHGVTSGTAVRDTARAVAPSVILLDIEMPERDGYSVCRDLKADPELATVPVVFMTTRGRLDDRLAGLALGADDYLVKPVDPRELVIRLERVRARDTARAEHAGAGGVLTYEDFLSVARRRLTRSAAAVVLMRVPSHQVSEALATVKDEIRRADVLAAYDRTHLVLLLPELTGSAARSRTNEIMNRLIERGIQDVTGGVAYTMAANAATVDALLADADHALMQARYCGQMVVLHGEDVERASRPAGTSILVAEDDPDVMSILDAGLRGAGHHTTLAFDGAEALASLEHRPPDVLILDLMMPKLGGFDLLHRLRRAGGPRPKIIVLSARGREEDIMRAFDLGADDYVTKPFNPQELQARVARLLR
jgi:DNA-binding response OmpR family regulator